MELTKEDVKATLSCTIVTLVSQRTRDVDLCEKCMKYMKKMNALVKVNTGEKCGVDQLKVHNNRGKD